MTHLIGDKGSVPQLGEVAAHIGVPLADLEAIVPSVEALMVKMAENAMVLLHHACVQSIAQASSDDPVEQFVALADGYLEWGYRYPREFRIIGAMPAADFQSNQKLLRYEESIRELMLRILKRGQARSTIPQSLDVQTFIAIAQTYAFGVVTLMLLGDLSRWNSGLPPREAARLNLRTFINQFLNRTETPC
ncbi:hypothetical protein [Paracoccus sp. (in: a-proteobacteria)]|uniref:hypothetical protein n=1 Tax=Paracoccus sp. TaxID=267 RepID=UPI00396C8FD7